MLMHPFPAHIAADINRSRLRAPAPARPHIGRRFVAEWSQSCACGGTFLGYEEEPCRPDCTGYYPVRSWIVLGHSEGGPQAAGQPGDSYGPTVAGPWYD
ncbi:hypothetical protein [Streptomyces botrytidirepellens]|uniref:Uncharacterized protein n=1 Tax=Streptomyces botrytidirepellens TaxID=2486417 RepID=A0A3M8US83_9ACTN|nr:hypothetical protein [Streptomyces botrytidirepellens]RNG08212.1 hypothetical protein EEJ42_33465 [Streptomyces botrytidirepellens]